MARKRVQPQANVSFPVFLPMQDWKRLCNYINAAAYSLTYKDPAVSVVLRDFLDVLMESCPSDGWMSDFDFWLQLDNLKSNEVLEFL